MIGFERIGLLALLLPAAWLWWQVRDTRVGTRVLRALTLIALVLGIAGPYLQLSSDGRDLVIVIDRSRSMPVEAQASTRELIRLAEKQRGPEDKVAIVTFGSRATIERPLSAEGVFDEFVKDVRVDGSDLAAALDTALELISGDRAGSILLLSDGELRGREAQSAARRAFARGIHIDVRAYTREGAHDLAVDRLDVPQIIAAGEPFQFSAWVHSDARFEARYELERDGEVISRGERSFGAGKNRVLFRDVVERTGVARYRLNILGVTDRIAENNSGLAAVRVEGAPRLLVVNHDGQEDTLVRGLRRSGINVDCVAPENAPLDRIALDSYSGLVLENIEAGRIAKHMRDIRRFVRERGGGLLITGGQASFGMGGYYLSPLDELLPVSMELRKEQRKQGMAIAIALDISGSMGATVEGGTKMELANMGTAAAIELLSAIDSVAIIAVDTQADVVQAMAPAEDTRALVKRALRIRPGGGGIYVLTALEAAALELEKSTQLSKHITLFSDASDSEQQEGCAALAVQLANEGVTLSIIALGTPGDSDAAFLQRLAAAGDGEIYFTTDAKELPRLFAQDTLNASKSTFIDQPSAVRVVSDLYTLGEIPSEVFPELGGYNMTYLRPGALLGLVTQDDSHAPAFAFQYEGLGRTAAFTGQIGGTYGEALSNWPEFSAWFVTVARWLLGQEAPEEVFGNVYREGREAVVRVEVAEHAGAVADLSQMEALLGHRDSDADRKSFHRVSAGLFEARFALEEEGILLPTLKIDDKRSVRLAPLSLPYSPEFEPSPDPRSGERRMHKLAQATGGEISPLATALFRGEHIGSSWRDLTRELLLAALILLVLEILFRRLDLWTGIDRSLAVRKSDRMAKAERRSPRATPTGPVPDADEEPTKQAAMAGHAKLADAMRKARGKAQRENKRG
ncbi:MAG: putative membrane protein/Mg-chelatase subunit ChlD [Candidatus Paceibacteria bacterium]|jgi:uncharacterized membrane protein/Mg-chelatase subunit ChlD